MHFSIINAHMHAIILLYCKGNDMETGLNKDGSEITVERQNSAQWGRNGQTAMKPAYW